MILKSFDYKSDLKFRAVVNTLNSGFWHLTIVKFLDTKVLYIDKEANVSVETRLYRQKEYFICFLKNPNA